MFGILNANVISVVDAGSSTITLNTWSTGNYWTGAYPNFDIDNKSNYPCAVLHTASTSENYVTYGADMYEVTIQAEVLATKGQDVALFAQEVIKEMRDNESTLITAGLKLKSSPSTTSNFVMRDRIRIHSIIVKFKFEVISTR